MPLSKARREGNDRYNSKCDRIVIQPLKPHGEAIRQAAKDAGESLQGYILKAVEQRMQAEQAEQADDEQAEG